MANFACRQAHRSRVACRGRRGNQNNPRAVPVVPHRRVRVPEIDGSGNRRHPTGNRNFRMTTSRRPSTHTCRWSLAWICVMSTPRQPASAYGVIPVGFPTEDGRHPACSSRRFRSVAAETILRSVRLSVAAEEVQAVAAPTSRREKRSAEPKVAKPSMRRSFLPSCLMTFSVMFRRHVRDAMVRHVGVEALVERAPQFCADQGLHSGPGP
jgi:hypothetical protein